VPLLKFLTLKALRYGSHSVTCKLHRTCLYCRGRYGVIERLDK